MMTHKRIYFDYAATTPVDSSVIKIMEPYFSCLYGNPSSLHSFGQEAIAVLDESRETIAKTIGADFREIIFTSSATEANNLALRGVVRGYQVLGIRSRNGNLQNPNGHTRVASDETPKSRIIVSAIEHESVLETARALKAEGIDVVFLPVDKNGVLNLTALKNSLNENTVLVSVMYVNNVVGTIQPIQKIAQIIQEFKKTFPPPTPRRGFGGQGNFQLSTFNYPFFHTDAVQAFQYLDCDAKKLGIDLMTLSSHKIYGPKGAGVLFVKREKRKERNEKTANNFSLTPFPLSPLIMGGGQEFGLRSGTENVPAIAGFAEAVKIAAKEREKERKKITALRDHLLKKLKSAVPETSLNSNPKFLAPHILNISLPRLKAQELIIKLDQKGIAVSSGSACSVRTAEISYVLKAMAILGEKAKSSIRFSLGKNTAKKEVDLLVKIIKDITNERTH